MMISVSPKASLSLEEVDNLRSHRDIEPETGSSPISSLDRRQRPAMPLR